MATWPEWSNVLPLAAVVVTIVGAVAGLVWTLLRLFRPVAAEVAREACDRLKADLESNHFHGIGERLDRMETRFSERFESMEASFSERFRSMETRFCERFESMETRFSERLESMETGFSDRLESMGTRLDRMDRRDEDRTARILRAVQSQQYAPPNGPNG